MSEGVWCEPAAWRERVDSCTPVETFDEKFASSLAVFARRLDLPRWRVGGALASTMGVVLCYGAAVSFGTHFALEWATLAFTLLAASFIFWGNLDSHRLPSVLKSHFSVVLIASSAASTLLDLVYKPDHRANALALFAAYCMFPVQSVAVSHNRLEILVVAWVPLLLNVVAVLRQSLDASEDLVVFTFGPVSFTYLAIRRSATINALNAVLALTPSLLSRKRQHAAAFCLLQPTCPELFFEAQQGLPTSAVTRLRAAWRVRCAQERRERHRKAGRHPAAFASPLAPAEHDRVLRAWRGANAVLREYKVYEAACIKREALGTISSFAARPPAWAEAARRDPAPPHSPAMAVGEPEGLARQAHHPKAASVQRAAAAARPGRIGDAPLAKQRMSMQLGPARRRSGRADPHAESDRFTVYPSTRADRDRLRWRRCLVCAATSGVGYVAGTLTPEPMAAVRLPVASLTMCAILLFGYCAVIRGNMAWQIVPRIYGRPDTLLCFVWLAVLFASDHMHNPTNVAYNLLLQAGMTAGVAFCLQRAALVVHNMAIEALGLVIYLALVAWRTLVWYLFVDDPTRLFSIGNSTVTIGDLRRVASLQLALLLSRILLPAVKVLLLRIGRRKAQKAASLHPLPRGGGGGALGNRAAARGAGGTALARFSRRSRRSGGITAVTFPQLSVAGPRWSAVDGYIVEVMREVCSALERAGGNELEALLQASHAWIDPRTSRD